MTRIGAFLALALAVTGCATQRFAWVKDDVTAEEQRKDLFECRYAAEALPSTPLPYASPAPPPPPPPPMVYRPLPYGGGMYLTDPGAPGRQLAIAGQEMAQTYTNLMVVARDAERRKEIYEECLAVRGYRKQLAE